MIIRSVRHRGLRLFLERNSPRLLKQDQVERVRNILTAVLSVPGNCRVTFEERDNGIERLDLEDCH